jgi:disulfide bond formation protein DsbB
VALGVLRLVTPGAYRPVRDSLVGTGLQVSALVAVLATAGSLWFSEGAGFQPCELCWYQRIAMYPLAVILTIAAARRDSGIRLYGVVLAGAGLAVSAWHNLEETFPERDFGSSCDPTNPCTIRWVEALGFWTIPRLAFGCFILILAFLALDRPLESS